MSICTNHIIFAGYYDIVRLNSEDFRILNGIRTFVCIFLENLVGKIFESFKLESTKWNWKVLNQLGKIIEVERQFLKLDLSNFSDNLPTSAKLSKFRLPNLKISNSTFFTIKLSNYTYSIWEFGKNFENFWIFLHLDGIPRFYAFKYQKIRHSIWFNLNLKTQKIWKFNLDINYSKFSVCCLNIINGSDMFFCIGAETLDWLEG